MPCSLNGGTAGASDTFGAVAQPATNVSVSSMTGTGMARVVQRAIKRIKIIYTLYVLLAFLLVTRPPEKIIPNYSYGEGNNDGLIMRAIGITEAVVQQRTGFERSGAVQTILSEKGSVVFPGVFDVLSAKIAERVGFEMAFITGYGASASYLGLPDLGFLNQSDLCDVARRICEAVDIPIIADADTGYGNEMNVRHTVQRLIKSGVKGCFLEDQQWPKRCGHMHGKRVVSREEYKGKIRAASEGRGDADFFIVARTDAVATDSMSEALARMEIAREEGADAFFIEAPDGKEQMKHICADAPRPLVANLIEGGKTPLLSGNELSDMGYTLILYPLTALYVAARAMTDTLTALRSKGVNDGDHSGLMAFSEFNELIGADEVIRHAEVVSAGMSAATKTKDGD